MPKKGTQINKTEELWRRGDSDPSASKFADAQINFKPTEAMFLLAVEVQVLHEKLYSSRKAWTDLWRTAAGAGLQMIRDEKLIEYEARHSRDVRETLQEIAQKARERLARVSEKRKPKSKRPQEPEED